MKLRLKIAIGIFVIVIVMIFLSIHQKRNRLTTLWVGTIPLQVEIANTPEPLERGLMHRKKLQENQGMFFIFDTPGFHSFWMKNTYIPLSIAFITADRQIIQIDSMYPLDTLNFHISKEPVKYAIEVNQGWFKRHKIKIGDRITCPAIGGGGIPF